LRTFMVTDRRARKLFLLCDKLGPGGVERYVREGRFAAEKMPLVNAWLEIQIQRELEEVKRKAEIQKVNAEKAQEVTTPVKRGKKSK